MTEIMSILSALGLSTAAGLNAYIPILTLGLVARYTDLIALSEPYNLITNPILLIVVGILAIIDFVGDKIPAVDHGFHVVSTFIAPVAGAIVFMTGNSEVGTINPVLAAIAGIVVAGGAQGVRTAFRPVSTVTTAGVANPFVSFIEDLTAVFLSFLAIFLPIIAGLFVILFIVIIYMVYRRLRPRERPLA